MLLDSLTSSSLNHDRLSVERMNQNSLAPPFMMPMLVMVSQPLRMTCTTAEDMQLRWQDGQRGHSGTERTGLLKKWDEKGELLRWRAEQDAQRRLEITVKARNGWKKFDFRRLDVCEMCHRQRWIWLVEKKKTGEGTHHKQGNLKEGRRWRNKRTVCNFKYIVRNKWWKRGRTWQDTADCSCEEGLASVGHD